MSADTRPATLVAIVLCLAPGSACAMDPHAGPAMNYHEIDASLATGGHFVGDGLAQLTAGGLEVIIDLRPEPPAKLRERVTGGGVDYVHIPVSWTDPTPEQFDNFRVALAAVNGRKVFVQCAANYRASAMTYLYRTLVEGVPEAQAKADVDAVWEPNKRWRKYMAAVTAAKRAK